MNRPTDLYEIRLRHGQHDLQVRGVPKRQAAEDFYLLGKLSKFRPLTRLSGAPERVPVSPRFRPSVQ